MPPSLGRTDEERAAFRAHELTCTPKSPACAAGKLRRSLAPKQGGERAC